MADEIMDGKYHGFHQLRDPHEFFGLAKEKTEGQPTGFDGSPTPHAEAERMAREGAYYEGHGAGIEHLRRIVPEGWHLWKDDWLLGYDNARRGPGLYWVRFHADDEWQPAEWTGEDWLLVGDDVERRKVEAIGARLKVPANGGLRRRS